MELNIFLCVLAALTTLAQAQSFRYRYGRRSRVARPASRLFGSNFPGSTRSRYDPSRRPPSRPFTIPGFESAFGSPTSSSANSNTFRINNLGGFNMGFGGPAFVDPIAGLYDSVSIQDGGGGGVGGGFNQPAIEIVNLNTAANTRSSLSREANAVVDPSIFSSRQQQRQRHHHQQQQNAFGATHDAYLGAGGLGLLTGNQDATAQFLTAPNGHGGFTTLEISSAAGGGAGNQQMNNINGLRSHQLGGRGVPVPTQNPLGAAAQLNRMDSFQFIDASGLGGDAMSIDLTSLGAQGGGLQSALNQFEMSGGSGLVNMNNLHGLVSGHSKSLQNQLGLENNQLGLDAAAAAQLGLGSNPFAGLEGAQMGLDGKQLGLGQNNILLDSNSLGLDGNHLIIQSDQMENMSNLGQSALSAGNQLLLDSSGGEMSILGNQLGLSNGQPLINSNQIGNDLSQLAGELNAASGLQGQMIGVSHGDGGQIMTSGDFPAQAGLGSTNQFFTPKEEEQFIGQSQNAGLMTSQLKNGLLSQITGA